MEADDELGSIVNEIQQKLPLKFTAWIKDIIRWQNMGFLWGTESSIYTDQYGLGIIGITTKESSIKSAKQDHSYLCSYLSTVLGYPIEWEKSVNKLDSRNETIIKLLESKGGNEIEVIQITYAFDEPLLDGFWNNWHDKLEPGNTLDNYSKTHELILDALENLQFDSVLDVGCGGGDLLTKLSKRRDRIKVSGIERNQSNYEYAKEHVEGTIYHGDFREIIKIIPAGEKYDLLIFCGTLTYGPVDFEGAVTTFNQAIKYLNPGGYVVLAGLTGSHLTSRFIKRKGFDLINKCVPKNIFRDTSFHGTKQLYIGKRKNHFI